VECIRVELLIIIGEGGGVDTFVVTFVCLKTEYSRYFETESIANSKNMKSDNDSRSNTHKQKY